MGAADIPAAKQREVLRRLGDLLLKGVIRMAGGEDHTDQRLRSGDEIE
jgi:hypothetical protein